MRISIVLLKPTQYEKTKLIKLIRKVERKLKSWACLNSRRLVFKWSWGPCVTAPAEKAVCPDSLRLWFLNPGCIFCRQVKQEYRTVRDLRKHWLIFTFQMSNITVTYRDGRVAQLEQVYIRGSKIRFLILPDMLKNAPMLKSMKNKNQGSGAGRGKAAILKAQGAYDLFMVPYFAVELESSSLSLRTCRQ